MIHQVQNVELLKELTLAPNEGVMFVKFVLLKQETLASADAQSKIDSAPSTILLGNLDEMKATLSSWLDEAIKAYGKALNSSS